jgi:hypothetical protein
VPKSTDRGCQLNYSINSVLQTAGHCCSRGGSHARLRREPAEFKGRIDTLTTLPGTKTGDVIDLPRGSGKRGAMLLHNGRRSPNGQMLTAVIAERDQAQV